MTEEQQKKLAKRILKRQAERLWTLVITTPGMADLAEPIKRVEHHFERLSQRQRVTVAVIASQLAKGFHEIEEEETRKAEEEASQPVPASEQVTAEIVTPDQIIPPNQDDIGDGSGTGD